MAVGWLPRLVAAREPWMPGCLGCERYEAAQAFTPPASGISTDDFHSDASTSGIDVVLPRVSQPNLSQPTVSFGLLLELHRGRSLDFAATVSEDCQRIDEGEAGEHNGREDELVRDHRSCYIALQEKAHGSPEPTTEARFTAH